jgi:outer membrane protein OmpA-like peptidoglycan-associated protein
MNALLLTALVSLFGIQEPGTSVMPFLRTGQGARASALGESFVSLADDASALYWNPAGLGQLRRYHLALAHHQWFMSTKDELFHAILPGPAGAFGLSLAYSGEPGIERWSVENESLGTFGTWHGVVTLGYGLRLGRSCFLGFAGKGFYQDLYEVAGYGGALDLGFLCRPTSRLGLGLACRNLGAGTGYGSDLVMLPTEAELGATMTGQQFNATLGLALPFDNSPSLRGGLEYLPVPELALRLGYRAGPLDLATLGVMSGLTAGLGAKVGSLTLDYALTPYGRLGLAHRLGLEVRFTRKGLGALRIRVLDAANLSPVQTDLVLGGVREATVRTDRLGELTLTRLVRGQLVINTAPEGYAPRFDTMYILGDREQTAILSLRRLDYGGLAGAAYDAATRQPIRALVSYRGPSQGSLTTTETGTFTLKSVPVGSYVVTISALERSYAAQTCTMNVEVGRVARRDFYLGPASATGPARAAREPGKALSSGASPLPATVTDIFFAPGKAELDSQFRPVLARAAETMRSNPNVTLELAGHTDPREPTVDPHPSHWELSQARAEAVRRYLNEHLGIAYDRIAANGYADTQPIAPGSSEPDMARNRRVEFRFIGQ